MSLGLRGKRVVPSKGKWVLQDTESEKWKTEIYSEKKGWRKDRKRGNKITNNNNNNNNNNNL